MKERAKKLCAILLLMVLCMSVIPIGAQAASYPSVFFFSDSDFKNLVVEDTATVGDLYFIRMQWFAQYNNEGYDLAVKDSKGNVVATASDTWYNSGYIRNITVTWNTSGCDAGRYTVEVTKKFYSYLRWNEAPSTSKFWIVLKKPTESGWEEKSGSWYYYEDFKTVKGWKEISGTWYYFNNSGEMVTGWVRSGNDWYYMKDSGAMATGWVESGKNWYFMRNSGVMATGWVQSGNDWYFMKSDGTMATGWIKDGRSWYYLKSSGAMVTGWQEIDGSWYYFSSGGAMKTGWLQLGDKWYWFDGNGVMATGWQEIGGQWEMFDDSGLWLYTWQGE